MFCGRNWILHGVIHYLFQTFTVGPKLHALFIPAHAEDTVFLTINKEDPDIFQLVSVKLPKSTSRNVEAKELTFVLDYINKSPKSIAFGNEFYFTINKKQEECKEQVHMCSLPSKGRLHRIWPHGRQNPPLVKITVIHRNLDASAVIQGLVKDRSISTGLMVDPRTKALVLNGKPGHLQFYSLQSDKQLYNLDIIQQEYINDQGLIQIELTKAAFGCSGSWLATVEQRQENENELELQMKLWNYSKKTQGFVLNTKISMPHDDHITALCFNNAENYEKPILVTASRDGHFKVWVLTDDSDIYKKAIGWTCDFVGSYHKYQATNCCFSEDGSLLAVSFEEIVTIWDSETWELKCTFCQRAGKIRHLCFGRLTCSKYLLGTTENNLLCCWNLLSCSMQWSAKLNVRVMEADPYSDHIAAVARSSEGSDLFVFKPSEPRPLYIQKNVSREKVQWGVFVPRDVPESFTSEAHQWLNRSQFYFLTESQCLLTFSTKYAEEKLTPTSKQLLAEESLPTTPFSFILGKHRQQQDTKSTETSESELVQLPLTENIPAITELLHTPAHVLPSASFLCTLFVNSLLLSKETKSAEEISDDVDMEGNEESDDSDEEYDLTEKAKETSNPDLGEDAIHQLSKSEEKELRKFRKVDYSWLTAL
uniref:LRRG00118 n=1 Tax=Rattus norvegicus TaxID=10116 RepID=Q6QI90_RAT|nr:LRRG00118 [Rattus norvegicus]|eukprot:NP_001041354.1 WD repeat-containing protein 75 [Rattus norvegicus]